MNFFNQNNLVTQQHGDVGIVWLLATLGSKSAHKKVVKKDIMNVSIPSTCKTISDPPQPLALRLSSNLLYGVTLVYRQQTEYFYADTTVARTRLSKGFLSKNMKDVHLTVPNIIELPVLNIFENDNNKQTIATESNEQIQIAQISKNSIMTNRVFLNDDPLFNVEIDLLPELTFDDIKQDSDVVEVLKRKEKIAANDLLNKVVAINTSKRGNDLDFTTINLDVDITNDNSGNLPQLLPERLNDGNDFLNVNNLHDDLNFAVNDEDELLINLDGSSQIDFNARLSSTRNNTSRINSRAPSVLPDVGEGVPLEFENDFDLPDFRTSQEENRDMNAEMIAAQDRQGNKVSLVQNEDQSKPKQQRVKRRKGLNTIQIDDSIILSTKDLRNSANEYIDIQMDEINKKFILKNKSINFAYIDANQRFEKIEELLQNQNDNEIDKIVDDYYNSPLNCFKRVKTNNMSDLQEEPEFDVANVSIEIARGRQVLRRRRSSSASIEIGRNNNQSRSRSRSASDVINFEMLNDFANDRRLGGFSNENFMEFGDFGELGDFEREGNDFGAGDVTGSGRRGRRNSVGGLFRDSFRGQRSRSESAGRRRSSGFRDFSKRSTNTVVQTFNEENNTDSLSSYHVLYDYLANLKIELLDSEKNSSNEAVNKGLENEGVIIHFDKILPQNITKSNVVKNFYKLLEIATRGLCDLKNDDFGGVEIFIY